jgi:hypothetical protein
MKRIIFMGLIALAAAGCSSCKKEKTIPPAVTASVTVLSPNGGETFYSDEDSTVSFQVTWKSSNLPKGSMIEAELFFEEDGGPNSTGIVGTILEPTHKLVVNFHGYDHILTDNDGSEIFQMPSYMKVGDALINVPGIVNPKKILLTVVYPTSDGGWDDGLFSHSLIQGKSTNYFSLRFLPNGCVVPIGYSTTTGQPCKLLN